MNESGNDIDLWNRFLDGDQEAFGELFCCHYTCLFSYGIKICDERSYVEDCIQELFLDLWNHKNPAPASSVRAYLLKALKYKLLRVLKKRRAELSQPVNEEETFFELSHESFLVNSEVNKEKLCKLLSAFEKLTKRQREIVYLRFYHDLDYEEISDIMGINYQAARNLVYQSIRQLKNELFSVYTYHK